MFGQVIYVKPSTVYTYSNPNAFNKDQNTKQHSAGVWCKKIKTTQPHHDGVLHMPASYSGGPMFISQPGDRIS
jgi:hypothetical protein